MSSVLQVKRLEIWGVEDRVSIKRILDNFDKNGKTSGLYISTSIKFYLLIGELNLHPHIAHIYLIIGIMSSVLQVKRLEIWGLFLGIP
jgi:hypothetical protein